MGASGTRDYTPFNLSKCTGFKGQSRVILPTITSCYECSLDLITPPTAYPICTIASTPRIPEHCIEWASVLEWPRVFKDKKMDTDNPDDIQWLFDQACARAEEFGIEGVTWSLTQGVVKNIIPGLSLAYMDSENADIVSFKPSLQQMLSLRHRVQMRLSKLQHLQRPT